MIPFILYNAVFVWRWRWCLLFEILTGQRFAEENLFCGICGNISTILLNFWHHYMIFLWQVQSFWSKSYCQYKILLGTRMPGYTTICMFGSNLGPTFCNSITTTEPNFPGLILISNIGFITPKKSKTSDLRTQNKGV